MPIGDNGGGQLNIAIFEVGMLFRVFGIEAVSTTGIHPLLVSPKSWAYADRSRSSVMETVGGSHEVHAGRALRQVTFQGTFGVENRGLLLYLGTGEVRFKRFYKEVVRMGEAMTQDDVNANTDDLNGTPLIRLLLKPYDEEFTRFYINFYDFWHDISFQAQIMDFSWQRVDKRGAAQGMIHYTMTVKEIGPIVTGSLATTLLNALLAIFTTWDSINNVLETYTFANIVDSFSAAGGIVASEFGQTMEALGLQNETVKKLSGSSSSSSFVPKIGDGLDAYFDNVETAQAQAQVLIDNLGANLDTFDAANGEASTPRASATGDDNGEAATIRNYRKQSDLAELMDSLQFQKVAGKFLGMSTEEYQAYITSFAFSGTTAPDIGGSRTHVVVDTDTAERLEQQYGVEWSRILILNRKTPDEALIPGTELEIPTVRPRGPQGIEGLPTFGSHVGQSAWGSDLPPEIIVGSDGDLVTVSGPDVLEQGARILIEERGEVILTQLNKVPTAVRTQFITEKVSALLLSDERFEAVSDLTVVLQETGIDVSVSVTAINGGRIQVGEPA